MRKILALLLLTLPLAAAPRLLSPERPVGDPKPMTNFLASQSIDIASDGNTAVAAWTDMRGGGFRGIYATRLTSDGAAVDPNGIPIAGSFGDQQLQRIAWDGRRFLFVWNSNGATSITTMTDGQQPHEKTKLFDNPSNGAVDVVARPGGGALTLANLSGQLFISAFDDDFHPLKTRLLDSNAAASRIVRSGNVSFAVWAHGSTIYAQRIADSGDPEGLPLQLGAVNTENIEVAGSSSAIRTLIAYSAEGSVHVFELQPNGVVNPVTTYKAAGIGSIAATPDRGFVTSEASTLRRFDASGQLIDSVTLQDFNLAHLATTNTHAVAAALGQAPLSYVYGDQQPKTISFISPVQTRPRLATDGTNTLLLWHEEPNQYYVQLLAPSGQPLHERVALGGHDYYAVGFDGTSYVVVRSARNDHGTEIVTQRIARDGALEGEPSLLAQTTGDIADLAIAGNVVVWRDLSYQQSRIFWTTLEQRTPIQMSAATNLIAASDGKQSMIAFTSFQYSLVVSVPGAGEITIPTTTSPENVALGGNGNRWLVTYFDGGGLVGQFLQLDGTPDGEPFDIRHDEASAVRIAWDGNEFVVSYESDHFLEVWTVADNHHVEPALFPEEFLPEVNGDALFAGGAAVLAYQHWTEETSSARVFTRTIFRPRIRAVVP